MAAVKLPSSFRLTFKVRARRGAKAGGVPEANRGLHTELVLKGLQKLSRMWASRVGIKGTLIVACSIPRR